MRVLKVIGSIIVVFFPLDLFGHTVVGNGGQGVETNGKVELRDFFEINGERYQGNNVDFYFNPPDHDFPFDSFEIRNGLIRKLTEINSACPGLGDYLNLSIGGLTWRSSPTRLAFTRDSEEDWIRSPPADSKVIQLANRIGLTVNIDSHYFRQMAVADKIGLILHEAVFALVKPVKAGSTSRQPAWMVREIVSHLFSRSLIEDRKGCGYIADVLNVPKDGLLPGEIRKSAYWSLRASENQVVLGVLKIDATLAEIRVRAREACSELAGGKSTLKISSYVKLSGASIAYESYLLDEKSGELQRFFTIKQLDNRADLDELSFDNVESCNTEMDRLASDIYRKLHK